MIALNWIGSICPSRHQAAVIQLADAVLDWIAADCERRQLAALDDRALADFGANRCDVECQFTRSSLLPRDGRGGQGGIHPENM